MALLVLGCAEEQSSGAYQTTESPLKLKQKYCQADEAGKYSEGVSIRSGERSGGGYWAEGGGCIFRPIREVWAVSHNQPLMVWKGVDESELTVREDRPRNVTHFYEILYKVHHIFTVKWTMHWLHSVAEGTFNKPKKVIVNFQKISGTGFIPYWKGGYVFREVKPGITEFAMSFNIDAKRQTRAKTETSIREGYDLFRTGKPNWGPIE